MYLPAHFQCNDRALAAALMREHPFASLISTDDDGFPFVTHLPLHLEDKGPSTGTGQSEFVLWGHCAKPNPHWRFLQARPRALATFLGPHAYLSPRVYADLQRVPSWNYLAVHCEVEARLVEEPLAKDRLLNKLIGEHEPPYAEQWRSLGEDFAHKMLAGVVGFELTVTRWSCKLKLNQHRPEAHAAMHTGYVAGNDDERELGMWMERLGMGGK